MSFRSIIVNQALGPNFQGDQQQQSSNAPLALPLTMDFFLQWSGGSAGSSGHVSGTTINAITRSFIINDDKPNDSDNYFTPIFYVGKAQTSTPTVVGLTGDIFLLSSIVTSWSKDDGAQTKDDRAQTRDTIPSDFTMTLNSSDNIVQMPTFIFDPNQSEGTYTISMFAQDASHYIIKDVTIEAQKILTSR